MSFILGTHEKEVRGLESLIQVEGTSQSLCMLGVFKCQYLLYSRAVEPGCLRFFICQMPSVSSSIKWKKSKPHVKIK
jgi:hypothetical protein